MSWLRDARAESAREGMPRERAGSETAATCPARRSSRARDGVIAPSDPAVVKEYPPPLRAKKGAFVEPSPPRNVIVNFGICFFCHKRISLKTLQNHSTVRFRRFRENHTASPMAV